MMTPSTRLTLGEDPCGYTQPLFGPDDLYHPKHLSPLYLKGYWISEKEGQLLQIDTNIGCPLVREGLEGKEILFLVHPKSDSLFEKLVANKTEFPIPAIALSSFRTHLIAMPNSIYTMVKLSLDVHISGTLRTVSAKECGCSVGMSAFLRRKSTANISFISDDMAFFPAAAKGGLIHRPIPNSMLDSQYVIPFFSLLGDKNQQLFNLLVEKSTLSSIQFIDAYLLKPLAKMFVDLIYNQHISLEAHPQNLLVSIDTTNELQISFMYRDFAGVNALFSEKELEALPECLRNREYYYLNTHDIDTGRALEFFVITALFNLTKQLFKSKTLFDPDFQNWKSAMIEKNYTANWDIENENPDAHNPNVGRDQFCRYGYIEKKFAHFFLDELISQKILKKIAGKQELAAYQYFKEKIESERCVETEWFYHLILETYRSYREAKEECIAIQSVLCLLDTTIKTSIPRPFSAPSSDLFKRAITRLQTLFEMGYIERAIDNDPFLSVLALQIQTEIKHLDLECELAHKNYPHEPSFTGPYPFGSSSKALLSALDFLSILVNPEKIDVEPENFNLIESELARLKNEEALWVKAAIANSFETYNQFRYRLESEGLNASFPQFAPLIQFLHLSLKRKEIVEAGKQSQPLAQFRTIISARLQGIQDLGYPYRNMLDEIESALSFFDCYERGRKREKEAPPLFHTSLYQYYSAYLKQELPIHILFPTLSDLGATDLLKVRGIPLGFLGVHPTEIWVDGFAQTPFEFWSHDINHTRRMWQFFKEEAAKQQQTVLQFSQYSHRYVIEKLIPLIELKSEDSYEIANRKRMIKIILFELLHEEAFPAHPKILADALMAPPESPTAIEVMKGNKVQYTMERSVGKLSLIHIKLTTNFYDLIDERKEWIVAQDCRSKIHVLNAAIEMAEKLELPDIDTSLLWQYLETPPWFSARPIGGASYK